jgi:hypothetical protein
MFDSWFSTLPSWAQAIAIAVALAPGIPDWLPHRPPEKTKQELRLISIIYDGTSLPSRYHTESTGFQFFFSGRHANINPSGDLFQKILNAPHKRLGL